MVDKQNKEISVRQQCKLLSLNRSGYYYKAADKDDTEASNLIAEIYSKNPVYGYRRVTAVLQRYGYVINHKKVLRLMQEMNIRAIYPGPKTSKPDKSNIVYPYLLGGLTIYRPNQVWQVDITYLRTYYGFMYLVALIDVYSRYVVGARLSNSLCKESCLDALNDAIYRYNIPMIINSDGGSQFTSEDWIKILTGYNIRISMTGTGRCLDNVYIERLWRSFKSEGSYLYDWRSVEELKNNIPRWIKWYNEERPHQSLKYMTPSEVYFGFMDRSADLSLTPKNQLRVFT